MSCFTTLLHHKYRNTVDASERNVRSEQDDSLLFFIIFPLLLSKKVFVISFSFGYSWLDDLHSINKAETEGILKGQQQTDTQSLFKPPAENCNT